MRHSVAPLLLTAIMAAACGSATTGSPSITSPSSTTVGGAIPSSTAEVAETTTVHPLLFEVSIHVEGWQREDEVEDMFDRHVAGILELATIAHDHQALLTFELSQVFMDGVVTWQSDVLDRLDTLGHGIAIHADVGGRGTPNLDALTRPLRAMRRRLAELGFETTHASGVCSRGPWVEALLAAGYTTSNGGVAYCATSMDPGLLREDQLWVLACGTPQECHGPAPIGDGRRMHPFFVTSSENWMVSDAEDGLLLVVSESGSTLPCLDGTAEPGSGQCRLDLDDGQALTLVIEEYLAERTAGRTSVLSYSWSIGSMPEPEPMEQLFSSVDPYVSSGQLQWATAPQVARLIR